MRTSNKHQLIIIGAILIGVLTIYILSFLFPFRIDLTEEKRFSLHPATLEVLSELDEPLEIEILLTGNLPSGMKRLQKAIEETLKTFNAYSRYKIDYYYQDPLELTEDQQKEYVLTLADYGINPTNLFVTEDGVQKTQMIFPGVVVRNTEYEAGALILRGEKGMSPEEILNQSVENLEFEIIQLIKKIINKKRNTIGIIIGHGEEAKEDAFGIVEALVEDYEVYKIPMEQAKKVEDFDPFSVLIVSGPESSYTEQEVYFLDQYLMRGGNLMFLMDGVQVDITQAGGEGTVALPIETGLDQLLYRYGVRVNKDLIQDLSLGYHAVMAGEFGDQNQMVRLPWPFYVVAGRMAKHPITKGLDQVIFKFVSSLDTVKATGVVKTPLIFSSDYSKTQQAPVLVAFQEMAEGPDIESFTQKNLPLMYLLEGEFTSLFKNRFLPPNADQKSFQPTGKAGKVIVASSGNLFRSSFGLSKNDPLPLGGDPFFQLNYANRLLLQNAVSYLIDPSGIISVRNKQLQIRPLDKIKVQNEKLKWQIINVLLPLVVILLVGVVWVTVRKRRFQKKK
jgi:ABC-2 type transport system permease protein